MISFDLVSALNNISLKMIFCLENKTTILSAFINKSPQPPSPLSTKQNKINNNQPTICEYEELIKVIWKDGSHDMLYWLHRS